MWKCWTYKTVPRVSQTKTRPSPQAPKVGRKGEATLQSLQALGVGGCSPHRAVSQSMEPRNHHIMIRKSARLNNSSIRRKSKSQVTKDPQGHNRSTQATLKTRFSHFISQPSLPPKNTSNKNEPDTDIAHQHSAFSLFFCIFFSFFSCNMLMMNQKSIWTYIRIKGRSRNEREKKENKKEGKRNKKPTKMLTLSLTKSFRLIQMSAITLYKVCATSCSKNYLTHSCFKPDTSTD